MGDALALEPSKPGKLLKTSGLPGWGGQLRMDTNLREWAPIRNREQVAAEFGAEHVTDAFEFILTSDSNPYKLWRSTFRAETRLRSLSSPDFSRGAGG